MGEKILSGNRVGYLVLDEADYMLDIGLIEVLLPPFLGHGLTLQ